MTRYIATNNKDAESYIINCDNIETAKNLVVNRNLDLSKEWNIKKDNFVIKNNLDVSYRDLTDVDSQWKVMSYILDCLTDKQLKVAQKLINEQKKKERN
jgi:hypothetical protein